jgi:hypothetical protein
LRAWIVTTTGILAGVAACAAAAAPANLRPPPTAPDWKPTPMVTGYFDHTAEWYRRSKKDPAKMVAQSWNNRDLPATVVLYNDIRATSGKSGSADEIRQHIAQRSTDIAQYLDAAAAHNVRVFLSLPSEVVERWAKDQQTMETIAKEFVDAWRDKPALAGFYVYDEPELSGIPVGALQNLTAMVRRSARPGANTAVISAASSAVAEDKPLFKTYVNASPPAFDAIFINRYPLYRSYGSGSVDRSFGVQKLGLQQAKAQRENLKDNEFANLGDYYGTLLAAEKIAGLNGRRVYATMQAYGLRDDCDGPECSPVRERKSRRSPTWGELLNMYASIWLSGLDGAVLYSRYFALHDGALFKRLSNLERLMPTVFRNLPIRGSGITLQAAAGGGKAKLSEAHAGYVPEPDGGKYYYLVVMQTRSGRQIVRVQMSPQLRITSVRELKFDSQGQPLEPVAALFRKGKDNVAADMEVQLPSFGVRIFELYHD